MALYKASFGVTKPDEKSKQIGSGSHLLAAARTTKKCALLWAHEV